MNGETGEVLWYEIWAGPEGWDEAIFDMALDSESNIYTVGRKFGTEYYDIIVQKWDWSSGYIYWTEFVQGDEVLDDIGLAVTVDGQDDPIVTGIVGNLDGSSDYVTVKFDGQTGEHLWRAEHPGAVFNIEARTSWLVRMDDDDVVMGSRTWDADTGYDVVLHRYAGADGSLVWEQRWNSGGNTADDPREMIRDAAGDLIVVGVQAGDYMVAKFAGATGDFLWQAGYHGPPDWYDVAACVAEAADGTLVVTGFSDDAGTGWDVATLGLDPDTGDRQWEVRQDGAGYSDEPNALALTPAGDVYVTGYAYDLVRNNDMLTLHYALPTVTAAPGRAVPGLAGLTGAWPNPFNPQVTLSFALREAGPARLVVHDLRGREVAVLHEGALAAGPHEARWDGRDARGHTAPAGVYLATLVTRDGTFSRKVVLAK